MEWIAGSSPAMTTVRAEAKPFVCFPGRTLLPMAHLTKPHFGTRHHKPRPLEGMSDSDKGWQVDWLVVAVVTVVFVAGFVWLF